MGSCVLHILDNIFGYAELLTFWTFNLQCLLFRFNLH